PVYTVSQASTHVHWRRPYALAEGRFLHEHIRVGISSMKKIAVMLAAVVLLLSGTQAHAGLQDTVVLGTTNTYSDLSLERIYFNTSGSAGIQVGDQVVGFIQLAQRTTPGMTIAEAAAFL